MATSEFTHCGHFDAVTMTRKKSCPMLEKEWDGGDPCPSLTTFAQCMNYGMMECPDYKD